MATATLAMIFGSSGASLMALAIMISTFGCANGLILAGARVYYAMSRDGLFFRSIGKLNASHVPAMGLVLQGIWAGVLVLAANAAGEFLHGRSEELRESLRCPAGLRYLCGAHVLRPNDWRSLRFATQTRLKPVLLKVNMASQLFHQNAMSRWLVNRRA